VGGNENVYSEMGELTWRCNRKEREREREREEMDGVTFKCHSVTIEILW
jgi:hypothetical protein